MYQQLIAAEFDKFKKDKQDLLRERNSQRPYNQLYYRNFVSSINPTSGAWLLAGMSHPAFILSALDILKNACPEIFNMFMQKYNHNANAFICGIRDGVLNLQQTEGGSPGSPEMSFLQRP